MRFRGRGTTWTATGRHRGHVAAALIATALALSACTGGDGGSKATTPAAAPITPIPETTVEPPPPEMPAAARQRTLPGAEAMMRHVLALYDRAFATGDGAPFGALADKECTGCQAVVAAADKTKSGGYVITGGAITVEELVSTWVNKNEDAVVTADVAQAGYTVRKQTGPVLKQGKGGKKSVTAVLRWGDGGWRIASLQAGN